MIAEYKEIKGNSIFGATDKEVYSNTLRIHIADNGEASQFLLFRCKKFSEALLTPL